MKKWTNEEINFLKLEYINFPIKTIAQKLNRSVTSCCNKASKLGISRKSKRKYTYQFDFFDNVNVLNSYWAGFIAADGCIHNAQDQVRISLSTKDRKHLEQFKIDVGYTGHIRDYNTYHGILNSPSKIYYFSNISLCGASQWIQSLDINFNITPVKTYTLQPPNLKKLQHKLAYIIGYWDGDGSIGITNSFTCVNLILSCCGTKPIMKWIQLIFDKLVPPKGKNHAKPRYIKNTKNCWIYQLSGYRARSIVLALMDIKVPSMQRKWQVAEQFRTISFSRASKAWIKHFKRKT